MSVSFSSPVAKFGCFSAVDVAIDRHVYYSHVVLRSLLSSAVLW